MTQRKHFKQLVRSRMSKTGESYAAARRQVLHQSNPVPALKAGHPHHYAGCVPAATAIRILLSNAGVNAPHSGQPFTEPMLFGIAGGVGIGVYSFLYEKEDFASFFIGGRHLWHDDLAYLLRALARLGISPTVRESSAAKPAEKTLRELLEGGPVIAWVDMAKLPHRAMPSEYDGGGYHVVTVYELHGDTALIGDLTDDPVELPTAVLAEARGRIKKYKNRVLAIPRWTGLADRASLVREGLRACHAGLLGQGAPGNARANFSLEALSRWAERLHGSTGKESWDHVFPVGKRLWRGLTSMSQFIEHWGNGGGLGRPLMAEFLTEAAEALDDPGLRSLADDYAALGRSWSALAEAALPGGVPEFRQVRALQTQVGELANSAGSPTEIRAVWQELAGLEVAVAHRFPLSAIEASGLRRDLQERVRALHSAELAAHVALGRWLG